jgi:hypothetical protein
MPEFMGSRFNLQVGQFDHLSKKNLSLEFPEAKSQKKKKKKKKKDLRGALDSAQFFIA